MIPALLEIFSLSWLYVSHTEYNKNWQQKLSGKKFPNEKDIVSYLTPVSDLDLAPPTDQFVASLPVRYTNPGCCVKIFQKI